MKKIILASTSPRRKELLENLGLIFEVKSPKFDEPTEDKVFSYDFIKTLALKKGESISKEIESALIISADTLVVYEDKILGKPKDYEQAYEMLSLLNGKTHKVVTAVCVIDTDLNKKIVNTETSEVTFNHLTNSEIEMYIKNYEPYDKAGSYGIQELPENFVKNIDGEYDNIVGLPTKLLIKMISEVN